MNSNILKVLLCMSILSSATSLLNPIVVAIDVSDQAGINAAFGNIATCSYAETNFVATNAQAEAVLSNATITANNIQAAENAVADGILAAAYIVANEALIAAGLPGYTGLWVVADWVRANAYAYNDWLASYALTGAEFDSSNYRAVFIYNDTTADANAQLAVALALDDATVGNVPSQVPATVKAYNDCVGVNLSTTVLIDVAWATDRIQADISKHNTTIAARIIWRVAHLAADDVMIAARAIDYLGNWVIADWVVAYAAADAAFNIANAITATVYIGKNIEADNIRIAALVAYNLNVTQIASDESLVTPAQVLIDEMALSFSA